MVSPTWFGATGSPLFGWWHVPASGRARAVVVLAPALARERLAADFSWRSLAAGLTDAGFAVLRFDYEGTGDSAGSGHNPRQLLRWQASIDTALASARRATAAPLVLVGHRLGAALAAECVHSGATVDALVLWDPVIQGKRYLRELRAQQLLIVPGGGGEASSKWADLPGDNLAAEAAADVARLDLIAGGPLPVGRLLVLARPGTEDALAAVAAAGAIQTTLGQPELLNLDPLHARPARESIAQIVEWSKSTIGPDTHPVDAATSTTAGLWPEAPEVTVDGALERHERCSANEVAEHAQYLADGSIFAVITEPADAGNEPETVLLLSAGVELHTGPGRLWVDLARQWARMGLRVVRCDLSGLGESPPRPGQQAQTIYDPTAMEDVIALARALNPANPHKVTLVGMCSGAYNAIEAATRLHSEHVILLNFGWWLIPPEFIRGQRLDRRRRAYRSALFLLRPVLATPIGRWLLIDHPVRLWSTAIKARLVKPLRPLRQLADTGTAVTMILGESDATLFCYSRRPLQRLREHPRFRLLTVPDLDHGLLNGDPRRRASMLLTEYLRWPPQEPADGSGTSSAARTVTRA